MPDGQGTPRHDGLEFDIEYDIKGVFYLLDGVRSLTVPLTDELGWLSSISGFQFSSRHDDGGDAQLLEAQIALESLSLSFTSPDSCKSWSSLAPTFEILLPEKIVGH